MSFLKHLLNAIYEPLSSDFVLFCENEMDILIKKKSLQPNGSNRFLLHGSYIALQHVPQLLNSNIRLVLLTNLCLQSRGLQKHV